MLSKPTRWQARWNPPAEIHKVLCSFWASPLHPSLPSAMLFFVFLPSDSSTYSRSTFGSFYVRVVLRSTFCLQRLALHQWHLGTSDIIAEAVSIVLDPARLFLVLSYGISPGMGKDISSSTKNFLDYIFSSKSCSLTAWPFTISW